MQDHEEDEDDETDSEEEDSKEDASMDLAVRKMKEVELIHRQSSQEDDGAEDTLTTTT